jgi:Leucine-rich repeat (LRR) protein
MEKIKIYKIGLCLSFFVFLIVLEKPKQIQSQDRANDVSNKANPTEYYKSAKGLYGRSLKEPDTVRLYGMALCSDDLVPLTKCAPILKTLVISFAPKINDDSSIIDVLEYQINLENLGLSELSISDETMRSIAQLPRLKRLQLMQLKFVTWWGVYHLAQSEMLCKNLEELILYGSYIGDIGSQSDYLNEDQMKIWEEYERQGGLTILGRFQNLQSLVIIGFDFPIRNEEHAERMFLSISKLPKLTKLMLPGGKISDDHVSKYIAQLHELRSLDLSRSEITDESLNSILKLKNLYELDIKNTSITFNGLKILKKHPTLKFIYCTSGISKEECERYNNESQDKENSNTIRIELDRSVGVNYAL